MFIRGKEMKGEENGCLIEWIFWDMDLGHGSPSDHKDWILGTVGWIIA